MLCMAGVKEHKIVSVDIKSIKFDDDNPNEMSDEQMAALGEALDKFGNLAPVILGQPDKKGEYSVIDGEHRVRAYIEKGIDKIPAHVIDVSRIDKKILRQVMNKLRGQHDVSRDEAEFTKIGNANKLGILSKLLAEPKESFLAHSLSGNVDESPLEHHEDTYLHGNLKQLFIMFDNDAYEAMMPRLALIRECMGLENNTDMFNRLVESFEATDVYKGYKKEYDKNTSGAAKTK